MSSLQQAPAKGQQVPPPVLIDGVSEQQIDVAVKAHVRSKAQDPSGQSKAAADLRKALDELHVVEAILWQQAVLFRKIREEASSKCPIYLDVQALAELGEREGERWNASVEATLKDLGEVVS